MSVQESARESFFYWKGDWWFNLRDTCKATWDANVQKAQLFWEEAKTKWREEGGAFLALFWVTATTSVWLGTGLFLPILFVVFGLLFSFAFVTYNLLAYSIYGLESIWLKIHGVYTLCPACSRSAALPVFICHCGTEHYCLRPTPRYGVFARVCKCGEKLSTSTFLKRGRLGARCPHDDCQAPLSGEAYRPTTIALIGGTSAGKSMVRSIMACWAWELCRQWERVGWKCLDYEGGVPVSNDGKEIEKIKERMRLGIKEESTQYEKKVQAICINLKKPDVTFPLKLYFFDPAGESFGGDRSSEHFYYQHLRTVVIVIDPFSFAQVRQDFVNKLMPDISPSPNPPEGIFDNWLLNMEANHGGLEHRTKNVLCAVLINKTDVPGFEQKTGLRTGASDQECQNFFLRCGLDNFIQQVQKCNFRECRYFAVSTTGGVPLGQRFQPKEIENVMGWLLNHDLF